METYLLVMALNLCAGKPTSPMDIVTLRSGDIATVFCVDGGHLITTQTFRMGPGACLKGPMQFFAIDGKEMLSISAGQDLPAGCSK